jgi:chlorobactene glucosyltransferase
MLALICGAVWAFLVLYLLSRVVRQFGNFRRATLPAVSRAADLPTVAIVVPVRNEIDNIELCLTGLSAQTGLPRRAPIIVVDDGSQDGTKEAVERFIAAEPSIELLDAGVLPAGWAGKPHACWQGALSAKADWLCFLDADVRVAPELIASAVSTAAAGGIDMLSLHPRQELGSFWERVVIPAGLIAIAGAKSFVAASEDVVNGQFLLVRRGPYFAVGGHRAVRSEICEDRALAALIRTGGFKLQVLAAPHLAHTRMYRDLRSLWLGFSKNSGEILGSTGKTLVAAAIVLPFGWMAWLLPAALVPAAVAAPSAANITGAVFAGIGTGIVVGIHCGAARHFRIPPIFGLTFPIGYSVVACLACRGVISQLTGRVTWKGRTYRLGKSSPSRA